MVRERGRSALGVSTLIRLGSMNLGSLLLGLGVGWFVDRQLDSSPVFVLIGLAVGIAAGLTASWMQIRRYLTNSGSQ
jgi:ATP synthase protein I